MERAPVLVRALLVAAAQQRFMQRVVFQGDNIAVR
jgi:hypothetical protein